MFKAPTISKGSTKINTTITMSSLNNIDDDDSSMVNGPWSLYNQEIILEEQQQQQQPINNYNEEEININEASRASGKYSATVVPKAAAGSMKIRKKRMMRRSTSTSTRINNDQLNAEEELGTSSSFVKKKLDHNAKERIRRMKLNASYLALRALLPDSRRSKKRWSAPSIVDKVLKYIPEVENEIQELESKKQNTISINVQLEAAKKKKNVDNENIEYPTISVNEINKGEVIVQICMPHIHMQGGGISTLAFTSLLQSVEDDHQRIFCIKSVSTVYVCETRTCYHLHIQMNHISDGADYIAELRDKLLSWLR